MTGTVGEVGVDWSLLWKLDVAGHASANTKLLSAARNGPRHCLVTLS
jgi:hypothetical protein